VLAEGKPVQLIDTRPKHFVSRQQDIGARYVTVGHSGWKAIGAPVETHQ
jgi:hypothetical protein